MRHTPDRDGPKINRNESKKGRGERSVLFRGLAAYDMGEWSGFSVTDSLLLTVSIQCHWRCYLSLFVFVGGFYFRATFGDTVWYRSRFQKNKRSKLSIEFPEELSGNCPSLS